jgi:hypothetical protein
MSLASMLDEAARVPASANFIWTGMTPGSRIFELYLIVGNPGANGATIYHTTITVQLL